MNKPSRQRVALLHAEAAQRSLRDAEGTMSYQQVEETSSVDAHPVVQLPMTLAARQGRDCLDESPGLASTACLRGDIQLPLGASPPTRTSSRGTRVWQIDGTGNRRARRRRSILPLSKGEKAHGPRNDDCSRDVCTR